MNKTKKTIQYHPPKKERKQISPRLWITAAIIGIMVLIGAVLFDQLYKRTILTIDDDKYYMEDLSYYFNIVESQYAYYNQLFGGSYWDMTANEEDGTTIRDIAKDEAIEMALHYEILYIEALADGYSLTADEEADIAEQVDTLLSENYTENQIKKNGFTEEYLTEIIGKMTLVDRYRQDYVDSLDIDDEAIKATVDYEEYRQYDIEYFFISTEKEDEAGNSVAMTEEEKAGALDKINALYEDAKESDDWSGLLPEDEEEITYRDTSFLESDSTFPEEFEAMMMEMENREVSQVYVGENGYYLVKMVNNASTESYDAEVEKAITEEENKRFDEIYNEILETYNYKINGKALRRLRMGQITL